MKTVAIVQARLGSTRLPGKVLADLAGEPMLARVVARLERARSLDHVVIATTDRPRDDPLVELCRARGWASARGSEDDVLARYEGAARETGADRIVRVTSDCPLIDPAVVDRVVALLDGDPRLDYASNIGTPRTYPRGLDVEAFTRSALDRAHREDTRPEWREHVTPYVYRTPGAFRLSHVAHDEDLSALRWTVDTPEDLELVRRIYAHFAHDRFSWLEALALVRAHPDWCGLNAEVRQKELPR